MIFLDVYDLSHHKMLRDSLKISSKQFSASGHSVNSFLRKMEESNANVISYF